MPELTPAAPGTPVCRSCGFTDCIGADSADCPRWPSPEQIAADIRDTDSEQVY